MGAETSNALSSIVPGWSKSSFLRQIHDKITSANEQLRNVQQRYKFDFDRTGRKVNGALKAGDSALWDIRKAPAENTYWREGGISRTSRPSVLILSSQMTAQLCP